MKDSRYTHPLDLPFPVPTVKRLHPHGWHAEPAAPDEFQRMAAIRERLAEQQTKPKTS